MNSSCCTEHFFTTTTTSTRTVCRTPPPPQPQPQTSSWTTTSRPTVMEGLIHENVTCDQCGQRPLRGLRFKCTECRDDFNLCVQCFVTDFISPSWSHRLSHKMLVVSRSNGSQIYETLGYARASDVQTDNSNTALTTRPPSTTCHQQQELRQSFRCEPTTRFFCQLCGCCLLCDQLRSSTAWLYSPVLDSHFDDLRSGVHQMVASDPRCSRVSVDTFKFRHCTPDPFFSCDWSSDFIVPAPLPPPPDPFALCPRQRHRRRSSSSCFRRDSTTDIFRRFDNNNWFDAEMNRMRLDCPLCRDDDFRMRPLW